jgi:hypothetical protein
MRTTRSNAKASPLAVSIAWAAQECPLVQSLLSLDPPREFMRSLFARTGGEPDLGAGAGVGFPPLTFLRLVRGLLRDRGLAGGPPGSRLGRAGAVTGLGWSGRCGGRPAGGFEQVHPLVLAMPAFG